MLFTNGTLTPSSGIFVALAVIKVAPPWIETLLQNGTYLVNDILKEDRKGKCCILQLI